MHETKRSYKGFHIVLFVPDAIAPSKPSGGALLQLRTEASAFALRQTGLPCREACNRPKDWLFAYAADVVDCKLAGGFGIDLRYD